MRGVPLLRLLLVATGLVLLGLPVWSLTRPVKPDALPVPAVEPRKMQTYAIRLTASAPARMTVSAANQTAEESQSPATSLATTYTMDAAAPDDIVVSGRFDDSSNPAALRVEVTAAGKKIADSTFWGNGTVEDVVSIPKP